MKINLENNFHIEVRTHTFGLIEDTGKMSKGKEPRLITKDHGDFPTLDSAIRHYVRLDIIENNEVMTLGAFVGEYKKQVDRISELVKL